jgi:transposase
MALSLDLRTRAVAFYEEQRPNGATYESVAGQFKVGEASVDRWLRLKRETGSVADRPRKVVQRSPIRLEWLREHVQRNPDATLAERGKAHQEAHGGKAPSVPALCQALQRLKITHKKRRSTPRSGSKSQSRR